MTVFQRRSRCELAADGHAARQGNAAGGPQGLPPLAADAHPNHRGPYTAAAAIICELVEFGGAPAAAAAFCRLTTLLPIAPELERWLSIPDDVRISLDVPREDHRRSWSERCAQAHGAFELTLYNVAAAEPPDREFIALLQRRNDSSRVNVTLRDLAPPVRRSEPSSAAELARACVDGDCTSQDAAEIAAYRALAPHTARRLHRDRAVLQSHASYAKATLYARLHDVVQRDLNVARDCIRRSLSFTQALPSIGAPAGVRATNIAFLQNTLALVTLREGDSAEALRLLNAAILYLWQYGAERFATDSMILFYNRARLHLAAARFADATLDLALLLVREPSNCEAWLDRALIHQRTGQHALALRDFDQAFYWGPPLVSGVVARARTLRALGQPAAALASLQHATAIAPEHVGCLLELVQTLQQLGRHREATAELREGLTRNPNDAQLTCLQGVLHLAAGEDDAALAALDCASALQPSLADAWANRATVHWRRQAYAQALADLDRALAIRDDATMLSNRGRVLERLTRWAQAAHDYQRAATLGGGMTPAIARGLERCANAMTQASTRR